MGRSIGALAVGNVIGDVVDPFAPAAEITVLYGSKQVANGCDIKPSLAADRPHVRILGASNGGSLYTLVSNCIYVFYYIYRFSKWPIKLLHRI